MVIVKIKSKSKQAKAIIEMLKVFDFVEVYDEKNPYNPDFVKKILERSKNLDKKKLTTVNPKNVWENIL